MRAKLKVMVVTDRFTPKTEGGAEISLFDTQHAMPDVKFDVRVAAPNQSVHEPCWADEHGIPVMRVQQSNEWPQRMLRAREQGEGASKIAAAMLRDCQQRPGPFFRALQSGALRALGTESACPGSDRDLIADSETTCKRLNKVVRDWKPDVIHADNKLSILLATYLTRAKIPVVAMVRDHRFFCGHVQQSMLVDGVSAPLNATGNPDSSHQGKASIKDDPDVHRVLFAGIPRKEKGVQLLLDILPKLREHVAA